ncbi:hypothetical protein ACIBP4_00115 [Micromonospora maritima]|uniref:Type VII secretion protein EccE n=1 Tax=Micromonospora maritima TaxID=986711 RepID=A0ABW7ZF09_9ACTN
MGLPELSILFAPGARLGWMYSDRQRHRREFAGTEPMPPEHTPLRSVLMSLRFWAVRLGAVMLALLVCTGFKDAFVLLTGFLFGLLVVGAVGRVGVLSWQRVRRRRRHEIAVSAWRDERAAFERAEQERIDGLTEWRTVHLDPTQRRLDVVGGNLWAWEALLTVLGCSVLAAGERLLVLDLTGEAVCDELAALAAVRGLRTDVQRLPQDLPSSDLLVGMRPRQLIDALIESMHGGTEQGGRTVRGVDDRILTALSDSLGDKVSIGRLVAGVRALMGEPDSTQVLTAAERRQITDELFSADYRRGVQDHLRRIEAHLHPLRDIGNQPQPTMPADLTCVAVEEDGVNVRRDLLNDLLVQWVTRRTARSADAPHRIVVSGADGLRRDHLQALTDICDRRGIGVVLLFRHLQDSAPQSIGTGPVGFFRLGNHEEATRAADFIGRQHRFVLSQLTNTLGGNDTHSTSTADSHGSSQSISYNTTVAPQGNTNLPKRDRTSTSTSYSSSPNRSWTVTRSYAEGTNWSTAEGHQRVYEYLVEPHTLQGLPDYALLIVNHTVTGRDLRAVECNPDIVTLPRVDGAHRSQTHVGQE